MTNVSGAQLESELPPVDPIAPEESKKIVGRSPWQIARSRLRRDKVSMASIVIIILFLLMAISAPILQTLNIIDPYSFHNALVQGPGSMPTGPYGGISSGHLLGVEPQTGRDLLSRLVAGVTLSMVISISATALSITIGTVLGIISGYMGKGVDFVIGRFIDLILAFPQLLMLLALSVVLIDKITRSGCRPGLRRGWST
jgi:ABC-type dipeptide/oligopeptide/nickel transport systems, permease components